MNNSEDMDDVAAFDAAMQEYEASNKVSYPAEIVIAIANGANPLKTIREWRKMSVDELASKLEVS